MLAMKPEEALGAQNIQQGTNILERLLNKPYVNEVTLRGKKTPLNYC